MIVRAKETSYMNATGKQWITKDKKYSLSIGEYNFFDDTGGVHSVTSSKLDEYFEVIDTECEYCNEEFMKSIYYNKSHEILEIYIEPDKTLSVSRPYGCDGANVVINYCPMCGTKLRR